MRWRAAVLDSLWLTVLLCVGGAAAEVKNDTPGSAPAGTTAPYRIQPGDVLDIAVDVGMPGFTPPGKVQVGPDGYFAYPVAGDIQAAGKTRQEVAAILRQAIEGLYRKVQIAVNVAQYHAREVFVLGEVLKPGPVPLVDKDEVALSQAVAAAGGLTDDAGEASLYRLGEAPRTVPPEQLGTGEPPTNLGPGDVLIISRRQPLMVVGQVGKAGPVVLPRGARLTDALALTGGITPEADAQHAVLVNHENRTIVVDLEKVLANPQSEVNLPVTDYHTLVVPPRQAVAVVGEVRTPGLYPGGHGTRLTALIARAGGLTLTAAASGTAVDDAGTIQSLDLSAALRTPGSDADVLVQGLRTVVIPAERREIIVVGEVMKPGALPLTSGDSGLSLSAALASAGGVTPKADVRGIAITHPDGKREVVDAAPLLGISTPSPSTPPVDPRLDSGTVVVIPPRYARVLVLGAVRTPGTYTFAEGDTVVDAIGLAGGLASRATTRKIGLLRRPGDRVEVTEVNLRAGLLGSDDLLVGRLVDRDIVVVPQSNKLQWTQWVAFIFGAAQVYDVIQRNR